jgi:hemerythrin-like domain-containing protein
MNILDALTAEHGPLYALFNCLEAELDNLSAVKEVIQSGKLLSAALITHACLEENLLFRALKENPSAQGLVATLRQEHGEVEQLLLRDLETLEDLEQGKILLRRTISAARTHFTKEEFFLFPLAKRSLSKQTLTQLGAQWADHRGVAH